LKALSEAVEGFPYFGLLLWQQEAFLDLMRRGIGLPPKLPMAISADRPMGSLFRTHDVAQKYPAQTDGDV